MNKIKMVRRAEIFFRIAHNMHSIHFQRCPLTNLLDGSCSIISRLQVPIKPIKGCVFYQIRHLSSGAPQKPTTTASTGCTPGGPDGEQQYEYDESRHEEYEDEASRRELKIRRYKKIFSTSLFAGTLFFVMFARRRKQAILEENFTGCTFIQPDDSFHGAHKLFCHCGKNDATGQLGCVLPVSIVSDGTIKAIKSFEVKSEDIYVASFPKTGTTWVQEITYLIKNNLNFDKASEAVLETRFPYLEYPYPGLNTVAKQDSPRLIKTHLPYDLLPESISNAKIIYVTRNPKDTVVSYYHFARMLAFSSYEGNFEDFLMKFKKDLLPYTPFFGHVNSYQTRSNDPNILILTYEELSRDPAEVIQRIARFLDKNLSMDEVRRLVEHTSFQQMASNPSVNYDHWDELGLRNKKESHFMRKGKVGDWRNYFNSHSNQEFDAWVKENNKSGFKFEYEI